LDLARPIYVSTIAPLDALCFPFRSEPRRTYSQRAPFYLNNFIFQSLSSSRVSGGCDDACVDFWVRVNIMKTMQTIAIAKRKIEKEAGMVILPIREYEKLVVRAVPTYYLADKEAEKLDKLVKEGLKESQAGKTIKSSSLKGALKLYAKQNRS